MTIIPIFLRLEQNFHRIISRDCKYFVRFFHVRDLKYYLNLDNLSLILKNFPIILNSEVNIEFLKSISPNLFFALRVTNHLSLGFL